MLENEILFDDAAAITSNYGAGSINANAAKTDCDCSSYTDAQDDDFGTAQIA